MRRNVTFDVRNIDGAKNKYFVYMRLKKGEEKDTLSACVCAHT